MHVTSERRVEPRLLAALTLALVFHGALLTSGWYRSTYDAPVHLFFADHYRRDWFSSWEPRWYTGFRVVSYPPGSHQLLALVGRVVGWQNAFAVVAALAVVLVVLGVYRFARLWVPSRAAGMAAILAAASTSIAEALQVFGQLPTLLAVGLLLNGLPAADRWIRQARFSSLVTALACAAATTGVHHVTTLFGSVFLTGPVVVAAVLATPRPPAPSSIVARLGRFTRPLLRAGVYGLLTLVALVGVVAPYWLWSSSDPILQIPIPHASRNNFLVDRNAGLLFFAIPWGVLIVPALVGIVRHLRTNRWPLVCSVAGLMVLGTGGTTPIPRMLLGGAFEIVTLDRFTFWATLGVLPLAGQVVDQWLRACAAAPGAERSAGVLIRRSAFGLFGVGLVALAMYTANLGRFRPLQPDTIDAGPIVEFLAKDSHDQWRYLTLGFGDQIATISAQTTAETVDGNYHSARRLPELTSTPVERLEGAKYSGIGGIGSLQQFLGQSEKYHLKFVFSNDHFYDPLLAASGWQYLEPLRNGVDVWERPDVTPLPAGRLTPELPAWQRVLWGVAPMAAFTSAALLLVVGALRDRTPGPSLAGEPGDRCEPWPSGAGSQRRGRRALGAVVASAVVVAGAAIAAGSPTDPADPADVVYDYYDAIDLRRNIEAWEMLDPAGGVSFELFSAQQSVKNGLASSFARLESLTPETVEINAGTARVDATLTYITGLSRFDVAVSRTLRQVDGRWMLTPDIVDVAIPPEPLVVRAGIELYEQGRRQVTTGATAYADVIDRPEVALSEASLVRVDDLLSVVGTVTNVDVQPAYVTVTAELLDDRGERLSIVTSAVGAAHTALPGETVPFRLDFEGVAGTTAPSAVVFDPEQRTPLPIDPADIASMRVSAKAIVTGRGLDRSLQLQHIDTSAATIAGELRNDGTEEITVPHVFVILRHDDGSIGYVADMFGDQAVRPQRTQPFVIEVPTTGEVDHLDVPTELFANGIAAPRDHEADALLLDVGGWAYADLFVNGFTRLVG